MKKDIKQSGLGKSIIMLGHRDDIPDLLSAMDLANGFGFPQVLAMDFFQGNY